MVAAEMVGGAIGYVVASLVLALSMVGIVFVIRRIIREKRG